MVREGARKAIPGGVGARGKTIPAGVGVRGKTFPAGVGVREKTIPAGVGGMAGNVLVGLGACALLVLFLGPSNTLSTMLPPRLSSKQSVLRVTEGQTGAVLDCTLDVGDDPIAYRWLKDHQLVTGALGFAYRGYRQVLLAFHSIERQHAGTYVCEASNEAGVHSQAIKVIVESDGSQSRMSDELPHTEELLIDMATSISDVLAEGECICDTLFLLHSSTDAPSETLAAQANLVHTIADSIISESTRVSVLTYSDYTVTKLSFGDGVNRCALRNAFHDMSHERWGTRIQPVLREAFKKFRKSKATCKVMFLPIFGSLGMEGADVIEAQKLKKIGVKIFILEVTPKPLDGVMEMASKRGDGQPYYWRVPLRIWPTIVTYMKYMSDELEGCTSQEDIPGKCVSAGGECFNSSTCLGAGMGCVSGSCQHLECRDNSQGCCTGSNQYWCGDVTNHCTPASSTCDGRIQCMNGADEDNCWTKKCPEEKIVRCQSSTLCLDLMDLCDGEPACPGGEDEDPRFCRSFPCPKDRPFRCRSGKCIENQNLCDGVFKDCEEGEDEDLDFCSRVHVCPSTRPFKCDYGKCIAEKMLCDGSYNCLDATDELVCNGVKDGCDDGSDENNCTAVPCPPGRNFKCSNGRCIDGWLICNKVNDCGDGSDELSCEATSTVTPEPEEPSCDETEFLCDNGACIPKNKICDGRKHCLSGDDEMDCKSRPCPPDRPHKCGDGTCVTSAPPCDGVQHCGDASDEINCTHTEEKDLDEGSYTEKDTDYDYDDNEYEDNEYVYITEKPVPKTTTTTTLPPPIIEAGEPDETPLPPLINDPDETHIDPVEPDSYDILDPYDDKELEEPADITPVHSHDVDDITSDVDAAKHDDEEDDDNTETDETNAETVETIFKEVEPAASSEQGVSSALCVAPVCTLIIAPMFVISFRHVWTR